MSPHSYLEHGITILQTRLQDPGILSRTPFQPAVQPFLSVSRQTCAGGTTVSQEVLRLLNGLEGAERSSWALLNKDLLFRALQEHHLPERLAGFLPEDRVSEIQGVIGELVGLHPPLWELERHVAEAMLQLAKVGRVILAGRAAHLVTRELPGGFHVRLIASPPVRLQRMMARLHCDEATARTCLAQSDQARRRFVRARFDREIDDPADYDLVLNTDRLDPGIAARIIVTGLLENVNARRAVSAVAAANPSVSRAG